MGNTVGFVEIGTISVGDMIDLRCGEVPDDVRPAACEADLLRIVLREDVAR